MRLIEEYSARVSVVGLLVAVLAVLGVFAAAWSAMVALWFVFALAAILMLLVVALQYRGNRQREMLATLNAQVEQQGALLETCGAAWCLFNREGLLLRSNLFEKTILDETLSHFDDLVAVFDDGAPLIEHFRQLQKTGQAFALTLRTIRDGTILQLRGERTKRAGEDYFCVLHLSRDEAGDTLLALPAPEPIAVDDAAVQTAPPAVIATNIAVNTATALEQALLDALPFPLWRRDAALRLVWVNETYVQWAGAQSRAAVLSQQIELLPPATGGQGGGALRLAQRVQRAQSHQEERAHNVIGTARRLLAYAEAPLGETAQQWGMAQDVTALAEAEAELARHMSVHRDVLENLGTPITIYGADQRLEFYNRAYMRLWDHDEAFLDSKPTFAEILEDLRTRRRAPEQVDFQRYKRERTALFTSLIEAREDMLHLPDGSALRVVAVPHPLGGVMFLHEDVTDKLALESSYNTLIAVQRETLDNLAEGVAVFGADGKLKLSNPAYARIWHLAPDSLAAEPHINELTAQMRPLLAPEAWERFHAAMVAAALERTVQQGRFDRADGTSISYSTVPLPDGAMLNSYVDITDTLRVEQALRASNAALATADRLKSEFVANVSYQLRTPLNTIMGFAEILTNQYFGTLNERQLDYAKTMLESSKRLKLLIDDVIDLAMVDAGRMALNRRTTAIVPLLQTVVSMMGEWARQQTLELTIDVADGIGSFTVDDKRIKQALFNLISNAIQYTPPGGHITVQARAVGGCINLSVIDTGIGIPQSDQERVWNKFERGAVPNRQTGVGLGLALVKSFIELHGGTISITSVINQGTQVTCSIPREPPELATPTGTAALVGAGAT